MEIEFLETKDNPLLERMEIRFKVTHPGEPTVSREAVREKIASLAKSTKERVIIDSMYSTFGLGQTIGYAKVYRTVEDAKNHERKHLLVRNKLMEAEKKTAAPAAAAKKPTEGATPQATPAEKK
jgi:small subunit ribosomal protein S24e